MREVVFVKHFFSWFFALVMALCLRDPIPKGMEVLVYGVDRGFALIEYYGETAWMRSWIPEEFVAYE